EFNPEVILAILAVLKDRIAHTCRGSPERDRFAIDPYLDKLFDWQIGERDDACVVGIRGLAARSPCIVVDERPGSRCEAEDERARNNATSLNPALNAEARLILLAGELAGQVIQADADSGAEKETADSAET